MPYKFHTHFCINCQKNWRCYRGESRAERHSELPNECKETASGVCNKCFIRLQRTLVEEDQKLIRENPHQALIKKPCGVF